MPANILVVDDEPLKRITLQIELSEHGYHVYEAADALAARRIFDSQPIDAVVSDVRMPGTSGLDLLTHIKQTRPETPVILMTAYATVDTAVLAIKRGAHDYITKPFTTPDLISRLDRMLADRPASLPARGVDQFGALAARSLAMKPILDQLRAALEHDRPVLLRGETGVGKTVLAEQLHRLGPRAARPLVCVGCAGVSAAELETELFGGPANGGKPRGGRFEAAARGTLVLEDVDELPAELQTRLLSVLGPREGEAGYDEKASKSEPRLICTTRRDLLGLVREGRFREDLYYRIGAAQIVVPPLRERPEDLPVLAQLFIDKHAPANGSRSKPSPATLDELARHDWPGNLRELENCVTRALALCGSGEIRPEHVLPLGASGENGRAFGESELPDGGRVALTETVAEIEKRIILMALRQCSGNQARAATRLGIPRTTLRDKMAKYSIASD